MFVLACILAFFWGGIWAAFLQFTRAGQFLAAKRTWITVVVGLGLDLLILLLVLPWQIWLQVFFVIVFSAVLIILRSLVNEYRENEEIIDVLTKEDS